MENFTLNTKGLLLMVASTFIISATSCTKDSTEDSLYETQAKTKFSPTDKPVVDRSKVRVKPDDGRVDITIIELGR